MTEQVFLRSEDWLKATKWTRHRDEYLARWRKSIPDGITWERWLMYLGFRQTRAFSYEFRPDDPPWSKGHWFNGALCWQKDFDMETHTPEMLEGFRAALPQKQLLIIRGFSHYEGGKPGGKIIYTQLIVPAPYYHDLVRPDGRFILWEKTT